MTPVALNYVLEGPADGPVVVLAGSLGTDHRMWDAQAAALSGRFRVLRYDHRGHGESPVPDGPYTLAELGVDLLALLDRLAIERASVCGLSIGGMVAMWAASEAPERFDRVIVCCSSAHPGQPETWHERAATVRAHGVEAVADTVVARWFTPAFAHARPDVVGRFRAMLVATAPEGYASCCEVLAHVDLRDRLGAIRAPTLVLGGADDPVFPPDVARAIADGVARSDLIVVPRSAHLANVQQPAAFSTAIQRHLGGAALTHHRGMRVRREVLGDAHVDRAVARTSDLTADFQDFITRYAWGEIWTRPGLDRRTRSAVTLTALVARGHLEELAMHVRAARRNGLTIEEIKEVLLQSAIYCGVPAANSAFQVAQRVVEEDD